MKILRAGLSSISNEFLAKSKFHILGKFGYLPKSNSAKETVNKIVIFFLLSLFLSVLLISILFLIHFLVIPSTDPNDARLKDFLGSTAPILVAIASVFLGFDLIKEVVEEEINALSEKRFQEGKQEAQAIEYARSEQQFRASLEKYYLYCLENSGRSVNDVRMSGFSKSIRIEKENSPEQFRKQLEDSFTKGQTRIRLRCAIHRLPDRFWRTVATAAALSGLGWQAKNQEQVAEYEKKLEQQPYRLFYEDIYLYLKAWLICSINTDMNILMPVESIGMRYLSDSFSGIPNMLAYRKALKYIEEVFRTGRYKSIISNMKDPLETSHDGPKLNIEVANLVNELASELEVFFGDTHLNKDKQVKGQ